MKRIVIISAIFIFAAAIGIGIYSSQNTTKGSDLINQNLEALALFKGDSDWKKGYATGTKDIKDEHGNWITIDCCTPSVETNACDFGAIPPCKDSK